MSWEEDITKELVRIGKKVDEITVKPAEKEEELSHHLHSCPNCQKEIGEIVKKRFDVDELENEEEDEEEEE